MARSYYFIIKLFLLLNSLSINIVARPLISVSKSVDYADDVNHVIRSPMDIFSLAAMKSGPSPGGKGHEFTNGEILGEIKNSGPSAGGKGHGFSDAESFGNIKILGPSSSGKVSDFTSDETDFEIKGSGPSAGGKGH